jgi:hypothetical protein
MKSDRVNRLIVRVAKEHGVSVKEILGASRRSEVVAVRRQAAIKLIDDLKLTYAATGRALNLDPSWVCQMVSKGRLVGRVLAERAVGDAASRAERGDVVVVPVSGERN